MRACVGTRRQSGRDDCRVRALMALPSYTCFDRFLLLTRRLTVVFGAYKTSIPADGECTRAWHPNGSTREVSYGWYTAGEQQQADVVVVEIYFLRGSSRLGPAM